MLIHYNNKWLNRWSLLINLAALYSAFVIPMRIAVHKTLLDPYHIPIEVFTYVLYVADVLINLRTTYRDSFGEEVTDNIKILKYYVSSFGFWIDLLSLLNYPYGHNPLLNCIGILKVNRLLRVYPRIEKSNWGRGTKIVITIAFYYLIFVIYLHVVACLWFFVIEMTYKEHLESPHLVNSWDPPFDSHYHDGDDSIWAHYENGDNWFVYGICIYYSVLVIGGNDLMPQELLETTFAVTINIIGTIY